ncbi:MAG TPA: transposase, partial [Arthrobacter sp.]|nr:transposase [Arthrobacter sp.]
RGARRFPPSAHGRLMLDLFDDKLRTAKLGKRMRFFFLPPYSPELNPDEQVWNDLKNNGIGRQIITGPDELKAKTRAHLQSLQRRPDRIKSFFKMKETAYAA